MFDVLFLITILGRLVKTDGKIVIHSRLVNMSCEIYEIEQSTYFISKIEKKKEKEINQLTKF